MHTDTKRIMNFHLLPEDVLQLIWKKLFDCVLIQFNTDTYHESYIASISRFLKPDSILTRGLTRDANTRVILYTLNDYDYEKEIKKWLPNDWEKGISLVICPTWKETPNHIKLFQRSPKHQKIEILKLNGVLGNTRNSLQQKTNKELVKMYLSF